MNVNSSIGASAEGKIYYTQHLNAEKGRGHDGHDE